MNWTWGVRSRVPVILAGGEAGLLTRWHHADDHSWWRWSIELSNHVGRPADFRAPVEHGP